MNTITSILIDRECARAEQAMAALKPVVDAIFRMPPKDELRILRARKAQLEAKLKDTTERIAILTTVPGNEYIDGLAREIGGDADLLKSAHQSGHLNLSGRVEYDGPVAQEFQRCYERRMAI